jgi:UDP-N-acetylmuramate--alanine ligase
VAQWGGNARIGGDKLFVVEADEYDRAFLELQPTVAVVNNVEADHLEIYGTLAKIEEAFVEFAGRARVALVGTDDPGASRVAARLKNEVWRFGTGDADLRIGQVEQGPKGSSARIDLPNGKKVTLRLAVPGMHNILNATGALGTVLAMEGDIDAALASLAEFSGAGRRFERLGTARGVIFIDDYAHHPSELVATLAATRQAFPGKRLVAVFQPHLFSRTQVHGESMGRALAAADLAIVTEVYAAREQPVAGVTGEVVARAAAMTGGKSIFVPHRDDLDGVVAENAKSGDVVITLGAGDVTKVGRGLVERWADS